jgi:dipeptide/tripeptide permease
MMALEWLFTMRRPEDERVAPPVMVRRAAAVVAVAAYPAVLLLGEADIGAFEGLGVVAYVALATVMVALWFLSVAVVYEFRRRLANAPDEQLDERERAVRDEAYLIAYRILGGAITVVTVLYLAVVPMITGSREMSVDLALHTMFSLLMAAAVLPSAVVAWRDTDTVEVDAGEVDGTLGAGQVR